MNVQAQELPVDIPRDWIETRLAASAPQLGLVALERIRHEFDAVEAPAHSLDCSLCLSYTLGGLQASAADVAQSSDNLVDSLRSDFEAGVTIDATQWSTRDGGHKICILGTRWRAIVRPQCGKNSGNTLAVIEKVQRVDIPRRRTMFRPLSVTLCPIRDELPCDPEAVLSSYTSCLAAHRAFHARQAELKELLTETRERRGNAFQSIRGDLRRGGIDVDARDRNDLHGRVRKRYSALRAMMDLLRLRCERRRCEFTATVAASATLDGDAGTAASHPDTPDVIDGQQLFLVAGRAAINGIVEENALLEVAKAEGGSTRRCRVTDVTRSGEEVCVEVDLDTASFVVGTMLRVRVLSRFGLRAHQRAVQSLLDESVQGYWPHLAQLLCDPDRLESAKLTAAPSFFYCDSDSSLPSLNQRQREAVVGALNTPHTFCIQGPPGTGKTTVICELVQQLTARGERVLLAAPTHVAVDEVLRRIGSRAGVHPLRLSWDEGRVAEDVRGFTPSQIIAPFVEQVMSGHLKPNLVWEREISELAGALLSLEALNAALDELTKVTVHRGSLDADEASALARRTAEEPALAGSIADLEARLADTDRQLAGQRGAVAAAEENLRRAKGAAGVGGRLLGFIGLGEIGRYEDKRHAAIAEHDRLDAALSATARDRNDKASLLQQLRLAASSASEAASRARETEADLQQRLDAALQTCRAQSVLRNVVPDSLSLASVRTELTERMNRLKGYAALRVRFGEAVATEAGGGKDPDALRRDLLALSNLFCCTTTGIAGSRELSDLAVDTLIVDEASRVTDSEFLIGAVKAKRWILVGDEHQLPPYVEQGDEHFIHALSALARAEREGVSIDEAVDALGALWEEDEEIHKFRRDSVSQIATGVRESGDWVECYRSAFYEAEAYVSKEHDDPTRALLRAMRDNLVRSLFERIVSAAPATLRIRLVEQRRMIGPIADIVSQPIYGGDYVTPPAEQLAQRGITPLVTPTFPRPITFLDTSALGIKARDELLHNSFINRVEARWVIHACEVLDRELAQMGSAAVSVSVLAFYKAQAKLIHDQLRGHGAHMRRFKCLRFSVIDAIDRIQGQESDVVILSFCRTAGRNVSPRFAQWLQDLRRVNVACTRAHRALIFVGQKDLLTRLCTTRKAQAFYAHLDHLFETRADVMERKAQFGGGGR